MPDNASVTSSSPRILILGGAPLTQATNFSGEWAAAWSQAGSSILHKADLFNANETWTAVKFSSLLPSTLLGGDIYAGDLGVSGQSVASSSVKQEIDGSEVIRFDLTESASSVTLDLSRLYTADDGTSYSESGVAVLLDAGGNMVGVKFFQASSPTGALQLQINSAAPFKTVALIAGAMATDGSFSVGGYSNIDGGFGSAVFTDATGTHGSDFLIDKVSFTFAPPTAHSDDYVLAEDTPLSNGVSVLANDTDPDGKPLSAVLGVGPAHGLLKLNADGSFVYTPDANYFGSDSFTYRAFDGLDTSELATANLKITPVNDAPVAVNDTASTNEDSVVTGNVITGANGGKDTDVDGDTLVVTTTTAFFSVLGAKVTMKADGSFSYDPRSAPALQALGTGSSVVDSFDYSIADGHGGTASAKVAVTVAGLDEPVSGNVLPSIAPGTVLDYYVKFTDPLLGTANWLRIDDFSLGVVASATFGAGTGGIAGKPNFSPVSLGLGNSNIEVALQKFIFAGNTIDSVEIESYLPSAIGGKPHLVEEYKFDSVFLQSDQSFGAGASSGVAVNALSLAYKTIGHAAVDYDSKGSVSNVTKNGWDVVLNKAITGPDGVADAVGQVLASAYPSQTSLDYYVSFDGGTGWLKLDSFSMGFNSTSNWSSGTGATVGKPSPSSVSLALGVSSELLGLLKNMESMTPLQSVQIEAYLPGGTKAGGSPLLVDEYIFKNVAISTLSASNSSNQISLDYASFTQGHVDLDGKTGQPLPQSGAGFDFASSKAVLAPSLNPQALSNVLTSVDASAVLDYFIKFTDTDLGTTNWLKLDSFSLPASTKSPLLGGSGIVPGKVTFGDLTLLLGNSNTEEALKTLLFKGASVDTVEIEAYRPGLSGTKNLLVEEYQFKNLLLVSNGDSGDANSLTYAFQTFGHAVLDYPSKGGAPAVVTNGWDVVKTAEIPGPAGKADAINSTTGFSYALDAGLDYYVLFEGSRGWLKLDSFSMGFGSSSRYTTSGGSVGRPTFTDVTVGLGSSSALVKIAELVEGEQPLGNVQIEAYLPGKDRPDGKALLVDEYFFNGTYSTSLSTSNTTHNFETFVYTSYTQSHRDIDGKAAPLPQIGTGYDLPAHNAIAAIPVMQPEALTKLAPGTPATAKLDYYIKFTDPSLGAAQWLHLDAFNLGLSAPTRIGTGTGVAVGKATLSDLSLVLGNSQIDVGVQKFLFGQSVIDSVEIEAYLPASNGSGKAQLVEEYKFDQLLVTSSNSSGSLGTSANNLLSLAYKTIGHAVVEYDAKTGNPTVTSSGFDVTNNKIVPGPIGQADALLTTLGNSLPIDAALDYYVLFDGAAGWLKLDSFSLGSSANSSWTTGTGTFAGKPSVSAVSVLLGASSELLALAQKIETGSPLANVQIEVYLPASSSANGKAVLVDEYIFGNAFLESVSSGDTTNNLLSFAYAKFTHGHVDIDAKSGVALPQTGFGYDIALGKLIGVPTMVPDVFLP